MPPSAFRWRTLLNSLSSLEMVSVGAGAATGCLAGTGCGGAATPSSPPSRRSIANSLISLSLAALVGVALEASMAASMSLMKAL